MSVSKAIFRDFVDFFNVKTKRGKVRTISVLLLFVILTLIFVLPLNQVDDEAPVETPKVVFVESVSSLISDSQFSIVGTVSSQSQAKIQSETSGRVTSVPVKLGDTVSAGQVIATLENAAEYASVLQAEGAYEAAQAAANIGDVSVSSAETALTSAQNNALSAYISAYATMRNTFEADLDEIFVDPSTTYRNTGYRPSDFNENEGRVDKLHAQFQRSLETQQSVNPTAVDIETHIVTALDDTDALLDLVQLIQRLIADNDINEAQDSTELRYLATLSDAEVKLNGVRTSLENANSAIATAQKTLEQAQIGGTNSDVSAANAQIKQALGVLRAAQASYANTIIRTPIAGTVNELSVSVGDFVSTQGRIALVANNNALQITAYIGDNDRLHTAVGQSVLIEGSVEGVITEIAPAVDSVTKKFEVKIGTDDETLTNGDSVTVTILDVTEAADADSPLLVPITAVKFAATDGVVFVVEDGVLKSVPVTIGSIRGSYVEIIEGIDVDAVIVVDARGLTDGKEVEAVTRN